VLEENPSADKDEQNRRKKLSKQLKRLNGLLTPMSKYYASEMSVRVSNDAVQVLGGSGYMADYPVERHLRDARITTIYEGTSQLQVVAAVRGVCSDAFEGYVAELEEKTYTEALLAGLREKLLAARGQIQQAIAKVKEVGGNYMDLSGRRLVDAAAVVIIGHHLLRQAAKDDRKKRVARRYIETGLHNLRRDLDVVMSADRSALEEYATLAGQPAAA
jgi:hypothetical protein